MAITNISALWDLDSSTRVFDYLNSSGNEIIQVQNFIENQFLDPEHTPQWINSFAPRSGKVRAIVPRSPPNIVEYAVNVASQAFSTWSKSTVQRRSEILHRIASIMEQKIELFVVWESIDHGKPLFRARAEVERSIEHFRYFANYILENDIPVHHNRGLGMATMTYEHRAPVGVYTIITSWNMPLYLLTSKIAPCLAFGCTGVAKPSELTSITAFLFSEVLRRANLPAGVMNIIFGDGPGTGSTLVRSPLVHGVSFTGGVETSIQIRENTASDIHKILFLEIRGSCPTIVFPDVDLKEAAITAASAAFENGGQLSLSGSRIYVHRSIHQSFLRELSQIVKSEYHKYTGLSPAISPEHYAKILSYLVEAGDNPARVIFQTGHIPGHVPSDGFWIPSTLLSNVSIDNLPRQELFGPVATVYPFDTEEDVVRLCNANPHGIGALILTRDMLRMGRVGRDLDAGIVWANCHLGRDLGAGITDLRAIGTGRGGGAHCRDMFTRLLALHVPSF
ncbi:Aldehyde/histidinol dehydrogenase [Penicillium camemberti]|uniref:Aldehyde/histidinol dehydrogenase n=1 Tax=Penicillium camemberti (strain FM 013) TaxID=1429867 RepID=A0A0G4NZZ0_PENC3|nr:Aldehyde/histidinol dehydrogenase [Penicillium camemberti]